MRRSALVVTRLVLSGCAVLPGIQSASPSQPDLEKQFVQDVRPFVNTYCAGCHGGSSPAAQFSLAPHGSAGEELGDSARWNHVLGRLSAGTMPPKGMKQPPDEARQKVIAWIQTVRMTEARKNAGDPGLVLARRLSNAEYNYTIRDLTGVDIQPTKEFPVDPANTAGFDNSGESLSMSPALLGKYLQAARQVANQMALTPDGIVFAPHTMLVETDREKFTIKRIVDFYLRQPTDYADYFEAAWRYKYRSALGKPAATVAGIAQDAKISPKYLPMVRQILGETGDRTIVEAGPVAKLRTMWRSLPDPKTAKADAVRAKCVEMRDFVVRIRKDTAMEFAAPVVRGLSPTSQPLMNWKLAQFNDHRRQFDKKALRMETDPAPEVPVIPKYPGLGRESAFRAAALMQKRRAADPDLVVPEGQRERWEAAFAQFASVFPDAFFISERGRYFPDDSEDKGRLLSAGYHNVMGYWRDDKPLIELILDDNGKKELDRLWREFEFMADFTGRTWVQYYFNQSGEVNGKGRESGTERPSDKEISATPVIMGLRDQYIAKAKANPANDLIAIKAIETHFAKVDATLREMERLRTEAEPRHVDALVKFAERAYRRPLASAERDDLVTFYRSLREKNSLSHEEAIRDSLVSVLMSPKFLYRVDLISDAAAAPARVPLNDYALASRLSYFLWSSMPDDKLMAHAAKGDLHKPEVLLAETRRMLKDDRSRAMATEFAGNWLDFRRFEQHNAVDRQRFPAFNNDLREAMYQEPIHFLEDLIRNDRPVTELIYGKYTFVNPVLAKHYGIPNVTGKSDNWVRVDDATPYGRGGLLPMSVFLTQNSPGLRTSPVKRGNWVVKRVLGEKIPPPPPNVPELPQDEAKADKPLREMLAQHRNNPACSSCHQRFDSFGLAFESYGPVGEWRTKDLAGRPVETQVDFPDGSQGSGYKGIQEFIHEKREKDFLDNLSRMLLAYSLNRSLQLSDEPLVEEMRAKLEASGYRFSTLVEEIVTSPQFLSRRAQS